MTDSESDPDPGPAGTNCALCNNDISPSHYRSSRAVLVNESGPGPDREEVKMVCEDCWSELERDLSEPSS
jgi:hypothetical protein